MRAKIHLRIFNNPDGISIVIDILSMTKKC